MMQATEFEQTIESCFCLPSPSRLSAHGSDMEQKALI